MLLQALVLDLLITTVSIFLSILVVFSVSMVLIFLIMNATICFEQRKKTRRNHKRRRK